MDNDKIKSRINSIIQEYNNRNQDVDYFLELVEYVRQDVIFDYFSEKVNTKLLDNLINQYEKYDNDTVPISELTNISADEHVEIYRNNANAIVSILNSLVMSDTVDNFIEEFDVNMYTNSDSDEIIDSYALVDGLGMALADLRIKEAIEELDLDLEEDELNKEDVLRIGKEISKKYNCEKYEESFDKLLNDNNKTIARSL